MTTETHTFKIPSIDEVEFTIHVEEEHMSVKGNAVDSGDPVFDKQVEDKILRELERGNVGAWAAVEVRAVYKDFTASDYLGGCSYKSEADFKKGDGYYAAMKKEAYKALIDKLKSL